MHKATPHTNDGVKYLSSVVGSVLKNAFFTLCISPDAGLKSK
jgi:hypothetical protein